MKHIYKASYEINFDPRRYFKYFIDDRDDENDDYDYDKKPKAFWENEDDVSLARI